MKRRMTRAQLLEILAVERHAPAPRRPPIRPEPITPEQAERNRQILLDALSDDPVVVAWRERAAS